MTLFIGLLFRLIMMILLVSPLFLLGVGFLALEKKPLIPGSPQLSHHDIANARTVLRQHNPRLLKRGEVKKLVLTGKELNLTGNYFAQQIDGNVDFALVANRMKFRSTIPLPFFKQRYYLNLTIVVAEDSETLKIENVQIGPFSLPAWLSNFIAEQAILYAQQVEAARPVLNSIQSVGVSQSRLNLVYQWNPELYDQARSYLIHPDEQARYNIYHQQLVTTSKQPGLPSKVSLSHYIQALFKLAEERSMSNDPVDENRAVLIVLGQHLSGRGYHLLFHEPLGATPTRRKLTLRGRHDLAQHFIISAALSASGNNALARTIGIQKELSDSQGGSGFSFIDLAADQAGSYLGELATSSSISARKLQFFLARETDEASYMPSIDGLPENMKAADFKKEFGAIDSAPYRKVEEIIEQRLKNMPLYREMFRQT